MFQEFLSKSNAGILLFTHIVIFFISRYYTRKRLNAENEINFYMIPKTLDPTRDEIAIYLTITKEFVKDGLVGSIQFSKFYGFMTLHAEANGFFKHQITEKMDNYLWDVRKEELTAMQNQINVNRKSSGTYYEFDDDDLDDSISDDEREKFVLESKKFAVKVEE